MCDDVSAAALHASPRKRLWPCLCCAEDRLVAALCRKQRVQSDAMAKAKRSTVQFKRKQLPAALAARKKNKPMRLKAAARVAKKRQSEAAGE